jgi:amino acid transporter
VLAAFTIVNAIGLQLLRWVVNIGIACEAIASVGIAIALILFFREQSFSSLFDTGATPAGTSFFPAFLAALAIAGWVILGFDACGSVAEETRNPKREVPRAIIISLVAVGIVDFLAACALMLATPSISAVVAGEVADPVSGAVVAGLGSWAEKPFLAVVVTGFIACGIAVQATGVRVVYSYSRDGMLPLSHVWSRVAGWNQSPLFAVLIVATLSALAFVYANALDVLVGFATGAYYVGFLAPVGAVLYLKLKKRASALGRIALGLVVAAGIWLAAELVNIAWPREVGLPWWQEWAFILGMTAFGIVGLVYFLWARPDRRFEESGEAMQAVPSGRG